MATVLAPQPALADEVVVTSQEWDENPSGQTISITQLDDFTIDIDNPGISFPVSPGCTSAPLGGGSICIGQPDEGRAIRRPLDVRSDVFGDKAPPKLAWIQEEAAIALGALHGVQPDSLMTTFGEGEIRAYTIVRLLDILDKKLYQEPMTAQEDEVYNALTLALQAREVERAREAVAEYERWESNPCTYPVPPPPTTDLPAAPNKVAKTAKCSAADFRWQAFEFLSGTPPVETFERWAAYRNPGDLLPLSQLPAYKETIAGTNRGLAYLAGLGGALAGAGLVALGMAAVSGIVASGLTGMLWLTAGLTGFSAFTIAASATVVGAILVALVVTAVSVWMIVEEESTHGKLLDRVEDAASSPDPLGIGASQANYAGLDYQTREKPLDPDDVAVHQTEPFLNQLLAIVLEWTTLTDDGTFVPDGGDPADFNLEPRPSDNEFRFTSILEDGNEILTGPSIRQTAAVRAPPDTKDGAGNEISGYKVHFARGWLMVSPFKNGEYRTAVPRLSLEYVEPDGDTALMSVVQRLDADDQVIRQFSLLGEEGDAEYSDTWEFKSVGTRIVTSELAITPPLTREISLLPTVSGVFVPGRNLTFASNVSDPGANAGGTYSWTIERFNEAGEVVQTWSHGEEENLVAFQQKFNKVGDYSARVRFQGTDSGTPFDVSGTALFTIAPPVPELYDTGLGEPELRDDLALNGRLFLDLRMMQETPSDVFDVEIEWAYGGPGDRVKRSYTVQCIAVGDGTCETGALVSPAGAPVNPQWSSSPSYEIPQDQAFLPHIVLRVTNSHGALVERVFEMPGEHRPTFADPAPYAEMVAGAPSRVRVTEVIPSALQPNQDVSIFPYVQAIQDDLPEGVQLELVEDGGQWFVEVFGEPLGDQIGPHGVSVPVEQLPLGSGLRGAPANMLLAVVPSIEPGYRAILRNTPTAFVDRFYRTGWPDWFVQVALKSETFSNEPFTGTVMCKLTRFGQVIVEEACEQDEFFPFPNKVEDGDYEVTVWTESDTQQVAGPPFSVGFNLTELRTNLTVDPPERESGNAIVRLKIRDREFDPFGGIVPTPFSDNDYKVWCSIDGGRFKRCLDTGRMKIQRSAGRHKLVVRVRAFDGAVVRDQVSWRVPNS